MLGALFVTVQVYPPRDLFMRLDCPSLFPEEMRALFVTVQVYPHEEMLGALFVTVQVYSHEEMLGALFVTVQVYSHEEMLGALFVTVQVYSHHEMFGALFKGLIIPGYILLSEKNPRGNVTKTHEGALLPFLRGFLSDSNI